MAATNFVTDLSPLAPLYSQHLHLTASNGLWGKTSVMDMSPVHPGLSRGYCPRRYRLGGLTSFCLRSKRKSVRTTHARADRRTVWTVLEALMLCSSSNSDDTAYERV